MNDKRQPDGRDNQRIVFAIKGKGGISDLILREGSVDGGGVRSKILV